jgi:hypothetical protein
MNRKTGGTTGTTNGASKPTDNNQIYPHETPPIVKVCTRNRTNYGQVTRKRGGKKQEGKEERQDGTTKERKRRGGKDEMKGKDEKKTR